MLATYNGERFIEQQIESILKQTYTNFHLAIQDDGSTDATLDIIKKYSQKDKRIEILKNESKYHGPFYNFHCLANKFKHVKNMISICSVIKMIYGIKIK